MKKKALIITAAAAMLAAGAAVVGSTTMFASEYTIAPPAVATKIEAQEMASTIKVPLSVNLAAIEKELNSRIPDTLHTINESRSGCFKKKILFAKVSIGCTVNGRVWKAGNFKLQSTKDGLLATMPVAFEATVRGRGEIGKNIRETGKGCAEISALIKPTVSKDWKASASVATSFRWCERPYIRVLGIKITIGSQVEKQVKKALADVQPQIAAALASANIRGEVEKAWAKLHKPVIVSKNPDVVAIIKPTSLHFGGFSYANKIMTTGVAVQAKVSTYVGGVTPQQTITPLPDLADMSGVADGFNISAPVRVSYDEIRKALETAGLGKKLAVEAGFDPKALDVANFDVYGAKDALAIGFNIKVKTGKWFDHKGRVYLTAKPIVDMEKRVVRFKNLGFSAATDNAVVQAGVLIVGSRPVMKLTEFLAEIPFGKEHDALIDSLNEQVNADLGNEVRSVGQVDTVAINSIQFGKDTLQIDLHTKGEVELTYGIPEAS